MAAEYAPRENSTWRLYGRVLANELRGRLSGQSSPSESLPAAGSVPSVEQEVIVRAEQNARFCEVLEQDQGESAHGGYLHALTFPLSTRMMSSPEFPLPLLGAVHLENTMEQLHEVPLGARLMIRSSVREFGRHRRGITATVAAEAWDHQGHRVFTDTSLYLAKMPSPAGSQAQTAAGRSRAEQEDPRAGFRLTGQWSLPKELGRRYAAASGDFNPIHLSSLSAKALGMKTSLIHGMYEGARALGEVADPAAPGTWRISFGAPAFLPARILLWKRPDAEEEKVLRGVSPRGRQHFEFAHRSAG